MEKLGELSSCVKFHISDHPYPSALVGGGLLAWLWSRRSVNRASLNDKVIFITGCDSGFGYSLALHCHENTELTVVAACHNANSLGSESLTRSSNGRIHVVGEKWNEH